jgi:hypothetical protein
MHCGMREGRAGPGPFAYDVGEERTTKTTVPSAVTLLALALTMPSFRSTANLIYEGRKTCSAF